MTKTLKSRELKLLCKVTEKVRERAHNPGLLTIYCSICTLLSFQAVDTGIFIELCQKRKSFQSSSLYLRH